MGKLAGFMTKVQREDAIYSLRSHHRVKRVSAPDGKDHATAIIIIELELWEYDPVTFYAMCRAHGLGELTPRINDQPWSRHLRGTVFELASSVDKIREVLDAYEASIKLAKE